MSWFARKNVPQLKFHVLITLSKRFHQWRHQDGCGGRNKPDAQRTHLAERGAAGKRNGVFGALQHFARFMQKDAAGRSQFRFAAIAAEKLDTEFFFHALDLQAQRGAG